MKSRLWAVAAFFNPLGYETRRVNYRLFRERLNVPLITVEWARPGAFQLDEGDADILVRVPGNDVLWQKERLLNLALEKLPPECEHVAWLDCDVIFESTDWPEAVATALESHAVIQPYRDFVEVPKGFDPSRPIEAERCSFGQAATHRIANGELTAEIFRERTAIRTKYGVCSGFAWAARRSVLETHGFYDRLIVGGGARAMLCAGLGKPENAAHYLHMTDAQRRHYFEWANAFHETVGGRVGSAEGRIIHLWHGDLVNRNFGGRYERVNAFDFDPAEDLRIDEHGGLAWATDRPELHRYVASYFESRRDDTSGASER